MLLKREQIEQFIEDFVQEKLKDTNLELVDVEYVRERDWFLRVYLDKEGGLEIEDCQYISELLTEHLDVKDPIKDKYYLEVSSPGLDRQLKKARDFIRHKNQKIDILFFKPQNGTKTQVGILGEVDEEFLELQTDQKSEKIPRSLIASIRLHIDF